MAVPALQYSFNILNWTTAVIKRMGVKTRKLLTCHRMHHLKADIDRLYTSRSEGGRELVQLELSYKLTSIVLQRYLETTKVCMMVCVKEYERNKEFYSFIREANKFKREFQLGEEVQINHNTLTAAGKNLKKKVNAMYQMQKRWQDKPIHGQYSVRTKQTDVDKSRTDQ